MNFQNAANACITATCPPGDLAAAKELQTLECGLGMLLSLFCVLSLVLKFFCASCVQAPRRKEPVSSNYQASIFSGISSRVDGGGLLAHPCNEQVLYLVSLCTPNDIYMTPIVVCLPASGNCCAPFDVLDCSASQKHGRIW